jgi:hypothetical protein
MTRCVLIAMLTCCLAMPAATANEVCGLPDSVAKEVWTYDSLPAGSYTKALAMECEAPDYSHATGHAVDDDDASGGRAWGAGVDGDKPGFLIYGPYADMPAGDYVAFFRIKITEEPGDDLLAHLDASNAQGNEILAERDLTTAEPLGNGYVQVPLAFHHPGGKLECRLRWNGAVAMRVDTVTVCRLEGAKLDTAVKRAPLPVASGLPRNLPYKQAKIEGELFPRSKPPASNLLVFDLTRQPRDWRLLLYSLQGLVNREKPRIYLITNAQDKQWLDWIVKRKWVTSTDTIDKPEDLLTRFRSVVKGAVIPDPKLPATKNVATMIAGVEDAVIVSPRLQKTLSLPVVSDLRDRWKTNAEAYRWALDKLWPKMNHSVLACLWPDSYELRDYLVENKIFIFWIPGAIDGAKPYSRPDEEIKIAEEALSRTPPNSPVMAYSWAGVDVGIGEGGGVALFSEFSKFLVGSAGSSNLSVHSGIRVPEFKQPELPAPKLQNDKTYVCFTMSDGDNLPVMTVGNWPALWADKTRGDFPIGWTISPSACMLIPDIMDYYYSTATPNDTFMAAVSGVGYCYPESYGKRYRDPARVFDGFLSLTDDYMRRMDLRAVCPSLATVTNIDRYAKQVKSAKSVFADYGRRVSTYDEATYTASRNTPVFRAATTWDPRALHDDGATAIAAQVREMTPKEKPAFLHVFLCNWFWDLPAMKSVMDKLGPDYVAVGPDQLTTLYRQDMERRQIQVGKLPDIGWFPGQTVRMATSIQNVSGRPCRVRLAVTPGLSLDPAETDIALKPGDTRPLALSGVPTADTVTLSMTGSFGAKTCRAAIKKIDPAEYTGKMPDVKSLTSVALWEAESLNHQLGEAKQEDGATLWASPANTSAPGHIVYGPYKDLKPGHYLAVFGIERTGPGAGTAAILDTSARVGAVFMASRKLSVDDLPVGEFKAVPLEFDHPGGALETRVFWPGTAPIAVDYVAVWEVGKR